MNTHPTNGAVRARGFTLIELLTVVAIIGLLIGILVPSLSAARNQAKKTATRGLIAGLEKANEIFSTEVGSYAISGGLTPFESPGDAESGEQYIPGAMWLAMQLIGVDRGGYVKPTRSNDTNDDNVINEDDWDRWYDSSKDTSPFTRYEVYMDTNPDAVSTVEERIEKEPLAAPGVGGGGPSQLTSGSAEFYQISRLPFFVGSFGSPILYYRAVSSAKRPYSTGTVDGGDFVPGVYDQSDNVLITGGDGDDGRFALDVDGWDFAAVEGAGGRRDFHRLGRLGYDVDTSEITITERTFASFTFDRETSESTRRSGNELGRVQPYNNDSFLLISAGLDGIFGTDDDITNFN